jgi:hypothetical protein
MTAEYKIKISHCINEAMNTEMELSADCGCKDKLWQTAQHNDKLWQTAQHKFV